MPSPSKLKTLAVLALLTAAALAIHGYHAYAEDAEIYLPGVEKLLHPELFPIGTEFFQSHASVSLFAPLIAGGVRITHLPFPYALFVWHVLSIFLFLLACWELSGACFESSRARWGAVGLITALLTLPVAGTALYIVDQYVNARNLAAFATVFAVARTVKGKYVSAALSLAFAAAMHPLMAVFAISLCVLFVILEKLKGLAPAFLFAGLFGPLTPAYHEAARLHSFHYVVRWHWYEWIGIFAPALIFLWFAKIFKRDNVKRLCLAFAAYDVIYFLMALIVSVPPQFEALARIQPMRCLHLLYIVLMILGGGLIADRVLKDRAWRWILLFLPLSAGMFIAQRALFPASAHVEWPWSAPRNPWAQAFLWIQRNTPVSALFAIDPLYTRVPGEDMVGFRAAAERSQLADSGKDSGAVSMFPPLAEEWWQQVEAQKNWREFKKDDFLRLQRQYGVTWVVVQTPGISGLSCPYSNPVVMVCRISG